MASKMPPRAIANLNSSPRVHRASLLNVLEQARLHQRIVLLEKARLRQARLTNQDIRLISSALDYIVNNSGHSPEGRSSQDGQQEDQDHQDEEPFFLYGERVASRRTRRLTQPQSLMQRAAFNQKGRVFLEGHSTLEADSASVISSCLSPRPLSREGMRSQQPRSEAWCIEWRGGKESRPSKQLATTSSRCSSPSLSGRHSRLESQADSVDPVTSRYYWENNTDEVTKKLLAIQRQRLELGLSEVRTGSSGARGHVYLSGWKSAELRRAPHRILYNM